MIPSDKGALPPKMRGVKSSRHGHWFAQLRCSPCYALAHENPNQNQKSFWARASFTALALTLCCCDPRIVIATPTCSRTTDAAAGSNAGVDAVQLGWSSGFEQGFCDFQQPSGYCYAAHGISAYEVVQAPVHSGQFAAAFTIKTDASLAFMQTRCVRQGTLPKEAYYGAWYFIPAARKSRGFWNLIHFHGGRSTEDADGLWDVSLTNDAAGVMHLSVYNHITDKLQELSNPPPVPIGSWFQVVVYLKRAADPTGEIAVYQDLGEIFRASGLVTDNSTWGQWYVGNLAIDLEPPESTLFVDDVTIADHL
jgi:hypothetical protein